MHTGQVHYHFYDWKNSFIVVQFLEILMELYPGKELYIVWDGWSAHTSQHTKMFIDLHPQIKILPLPTRASWLNPIERDFGSVQRFVLNNSDFESVRDGMQAIGAYIEKELSSS